MCFAKRIIALMLTCLSIISVVTTPALAADANSAEISNTSYRPLTGQEIADHAMYIATVLRPSYQTGHIAYDAYTFKDDSLDCFQFAFASMMGAVGAQRWDDNDNVAVQGVKTVWWYGYDHQIGDPYDATGALHHRGYDNTKFNPRYGYSWAQWCQQYVGKEIYLDGYNEWGEHVRQYYTVGVAGKVEECNAQLEAQGSIYRIGDIQIGRNICSTYLAYAQSFPGSIIWCNGHASVGVGCFESRDAMKQYYGEKGYDVEVRTRAYGQDTGICVAPKESYGNYVYPYTDDIGDSRYYLGRGWQVSASGTEVGCRMNNATTDVGTFDTRKNDQVVVLIPSGASNTMTTAEYVGEANQYTPRNGWNAAIIAASENE